jgi:hypothetical protein
MPDCNWLCQASASSGLWQVKGLVYTVHLLANPTADPVCVE